MELLIFPVLALLLLLGRAMRKADWEEQRDAEKRAQDSAPASVEAGAVDPPGPDALADTIRATWKGPWLPDPAPYWVADLPAPTATVELPIDSDIRHLAPEYVDDIYLEISTRPAPGMRPMGVVFLPFVAFLPVFFIVAFSEDLKFALAFLAATALLCVAIVPPIRSLTRLPLTQPVRFNRVRKTMYVYRFRFNWLKPFGEMGVRPARYDWSQLHAEHVKAPRAGGGARIIILTAFDPVDRSVIDRFELRSDHIEGTQLWEIIRLYMQRGRAALPAAVQTPAPRRGRPQLPEALPCLAPPIRWPRAMDRESRSAPE